MPRPSEARARHTFHRMYQSEMDMLRTTPDRQVKPYGAFGDYMRAGECSSAELESVARRNTERALERALRTHNATTEA